MNVGILRPCLLPVSKTGLSGHEARRRTPRRKSRHITTTSAAKGEVDVVLSSGFLAFAKHSGFLKAVHESDLKVKGVMGTSAGAYTGSLYCAGYSPDVIGQLLCGDPPIERLRLNWQFWNGLISLEAVVERLEELLPPTFEELDREFAVGVMDCEGCHRMINSGPLPEAVAASGAIPLLFAGVDIPGREEDNPFKDGGSVDRIGLKLWRNHRRSLLEASNNSKPSASPSDWFSKSKSPASVPDALVHVISRSSPFSGTDDITKSGERRVAYLESSKSGVNFFDIGDYKGQMMATRDRAMRVIQRVEEELEKSERIVVG
ncbi:hypothetical protein BSKO_01148 [Bryopsis sp. KO-2023]|nr:hypothetical protein BSKO_01148 [Bryopsis sp. KO-2023]